MFKWTEGHVLKANADKRHFLVNAIEKISIKVSK